ncbi:MAG: hypothetical protein ACD_57C00212G0002 [uncultured bacterium]|nr:MAG: hypothetical protein ACD_57C00212G0002 [uncultured bacterium]OGM23427.1 MAG: hypothetical protein A2691_01550 [Candidatus Woesebacteria bacterium RIFCSPHIGHO2_01_FULL_39_23]
MKLAGKKLKFIALTLAILILFIFIGLQFTNKPKQEIPTKPSLAPQANIPKYINQPIEIQNETKAEDIKIPTEAALLKFNNYDKPLTEQEIESISTTFGVTKQVRIYDDAYGGKTHIWLEDDFSLFIYTKSRTVGYNKNEKPPRIINKQLSNDVLANTALQFTTSHFPQTISNSLKVGNINYWKSEGLEHREKVENLADADLIQVNLSPSVSSFKVVSLDPQSSPSSVWVLPNGEVFSLSMVLMGEVKEGLEKYKLKTYEEVVNNIGSASLISVDNGNLSVTELKPTQIEMLKVINIELAYLFNPENLEYLQPIFILEAQGSILNQETNAFLYLPAISSQP